jgi:hypothetical protein
MATDFTTSLYEQRFVSLTTFKRNGEGVSAPIWIGRDGDGLFVWTRSQATTGGPAYRSFAMTDEFWVRHESNLVRLRQPHGEGVTS